MAMADACHRHPAGGIFNQVADPIRAHTNSPLGARSHFGAAPRPGIARQRINASLQTQVNLPVKTVEVALRARGQNDCVAYGRFSSRRAP